MRYSVPRRKRIINDPIEKWTNDSLLSKINLLQQVMQRKLQLFRHVYRMGDSQNIMPVVFFIFDSRCKAAA